MSNKVAVIGLDGATFDLLDAWLEEGALPNLQRMRERGSSGPLESCIPSVTFPAWKCYSTGTNPGKLGVFNFVDVDFRNSRIKTNDSTSFDGAEIWDYLEAEGHRCGVINMPTTYPPKKLRGFMVSGNMSPESGFTEPPELEKRLKGKYDYRIMPAYFGTKDPKDVPEGLEVVSSRFDFAMDAIEEEDIDFLHLTIFFTDTVQHFLWASEEVKLTWEHIDEKIGEFRKSLPDDWNLIVMSDHGLLKRESRFYLNKWLEEEGYLQFEDTLDLGDVLEILDRFGLSFHRMYRTLSRLGLDGAARRLTPRELQVKIAHMIPDEELGGRKLEGIGGKIDWESSKVIPNGQLIHVNPRANADEREAIVSDLKRKLSQLRGPDGRSVCRDVYEKQEIYDGPHSRRAPELTIVPSLDYEISDIMSDSVFDTNDGLWKADHTQTGILVATGPDIAPASTIEASLYDLAPTILHLFGLPIPEVMDGEVRKDLFSDTSQPGKLDPQFVTERKLSEKERIKHAVRELSARGSL